MIHRVVWWRWVGADCMWVVDVVWADYVWDGWFRLGGLRVNDYSVCVGCVEKYDGDW